jgi:hypothetical protein
LVPGVSTPTAAGFSAANAGEPFTSAIDVIANANATRAQRLGLVVILAITGIAPILAESSRTPADPRFHVLTPTESSPLVGALSRTDATRSSGELEQGIRLQTR